MLTALPSRFALLLALLPDGGGPARSSSPPEIPELTPEITRAELEAHVRWLADDARLGRVTGTPGCEEAAQYLGLVLAAQGLEPAGDRGTFLQDVPLERVRHVRTPELAFLDPQGERRALAWGADFDAPSADAEGELRVVTVRAREDLPRAAERSVALFLDAPSARWRAWLADAELGRGAGFGALLVAGSREARPGRELASARAPLRRPRGQDEEAPDALVRVHGEPLRALQAGQVARVVLRFDVERETVVSANVVGRIRGRGPASGERAGGDRAGQDAPARALVLSAHYDHIAHAQVEGEDKIFNGADDDASGVSMVLELAGALASGQQPVHDVIVLLATAEEIGLLGTREYLERPAAPLEHTLANLNFEMVGRPDAAAGGRGALWLTGDERTNLGAKLRERGLAIVPDSRPEQRFFERSDNYAFVLRGVVGQTLSSYDLHADYHKPSDEVERIDFEHMELAARAALGAVRLVVDGELTPAWVGEPPKPRR